MSLGDRPKGSARANRSLAKRLRQLQFSNYSHLSRYRSDYCLSFLFCCLHTVEDFATVYHFSPFIHYRKLITLSWRIVHCQNTTFDHQYFFNTYFDHFSKILILTISLSDPFPPILLPFPASLFLLRSPLQ